MLVRYGYEFTVICPQPTPMIALVSARPEYDGRMAEPESHRTWPDTGTDVFIDAYGNRGRRFTAPAGETRMAGGGVLNSSACTDPVAEWAQEHQVQDLPVDTLQFLAGSRYCETDLLCELAWDMFGGFAPGWGRVQAIVDYTHRHVRFDYQAARATRTAHQTWSEGQGVCRDFAHLAITLCRCLNIPARYVNGHLGDIGIAFNPDPMDYAAWMEVWLGGAWHTFDPRNNARRIGRIVVARGRDAADVPMVTSFGEHVLQRFSVVTEEVRQAA